MDLEKLEPNPTWSIRPDEAIGEMQRIHVPHSFFMSTVHKKNAVGVVAAGNSCCGRCGQSVVSRESFRPLIVAESHSISQLFPPPA